MAKDPNKLSRPPQFINPISPGPKDQAEWVDFYKWLFAQYQAVVSLQGQALPPNGFPSAFPPQQPDQTPGQFPAFPPQQPDPGDAIALLSAFAGASKSPHAVPQIPQGFPSAPYVTRRPLEIIVCTQATFPVLTGQVPVFVYVSDYFHMLYWNGAATAFTDGGSNYYIVADENPAIGGLLAGGGWVPVDGSVGVTYLKADGTLGTRGLVNTVGTPAYLKVGIGASTLNAPIAPTLTMNSYTPAGTISTPTFSGSTFTPSGTISSTFTGTPQTFTATAATPVGIVDAFTAPNPYTPAGSVSSTFTGAGGTPTGTISTPVFTGTPATLTGTISATAEPENLYSRLWYRQ